MEFDGMMISRLMEQASQRSLGVLERVGLYRCFTFYVAIWLSGVSVGVFNDTGVQAAPVDEIVGLIPKLGASDVGAVRDAEAALDRICIAAGSSGAESDRRATVKALLGFLGADVPLQARLIVIEQVGRLGKYEAVTPLGRVLMDDESPRAREAARRALEHLPVVTVKRKLREALPKSTGRLRVGILRSLGIRRDFSGVQTIMETIEDPDPEVRLAAIEALARIGEISSKLVVEEALEGAQGIEYQRVLRAYLRLGDSLVQNSEKGTARRIYDRAMGLGRAAQCAALLGFARAGLQSEVSRIVGYTTSDDPQVRGAALEAAGVMPGGRMTKAIVGKLNQTTEAELRESYLAVLAWRGDAASVAKISSLSVEEQASVGRTVVQLAERHAAGEPGRVAKLLRTAGRLELDEATAEKIGTLLQSLRANGVEAKPGG